MRAFRQLIGIFSATGKSFRIDLFWQLSLAGLFVFLELVGVALLADLVGVIFLPEQTKTSPNVGSWTQDYFASELMFGVSLIAIYGFRTALISTVISYQYRLVYDLLQKLNRTIFSRTASSSSEISQEHVVQLGIVEANNVCVGVYLPMVRLASEAIAVIAIAAWAISSAPKFMSLFLALIALAVGLLLIFMRRFLLSWGKRRVVYDEQRNALLGFSTQASRELRGYKAVALAENSFSEVARLSMRFAWLQQTVKGCQKYWVETLVVICLGAVLFAGNIFEGILVDARANGVLVAVALTRVVPSVNRMGTYLNSINYFRHSLRVVTAYATTDA